MKKLTLSLLFIWLLYYLWIDLSEGFLGEIVQIDFTTGVNLLALILVTLMLVLIKWIGNPYKVILIRHIKGNDYWASRRAIEKLKARSWLYDGTLRSRDLEKCIFRRFDLEKANLQGTNLQRANLNNANLEHANMEKTNLKSARLQHANLRGVNLKSATLHMVDLRKADLSGALLQNTELFGANLELTNLQGSDLQDANFFSSKLNILLIELYFVFAVVKSEVMPSFEKLEKEIEQNKSWPIKRGLKEIKGSIWLFYEKFKNKEFNNEQLAHDLNLLNFFEDLHSTYLKNVCLENANLQNVTLQMAKLEDVQLHKADLSRANLKYARLIKTDLSGAILEYANLRNATVLECNLEGADLRNTIMSNTNLKNCSLKNADMQNASLFQSRLTRVCLEGADLKCADLTGVDLQEVNMRHVDLRGAIINIDIRLDQLIKTDLTGAIYDDSTVWPNDLELKNLFLLEDSYGIVKIIKWRSVFLA